MACIPPAPVRMEGKGWHPASGTAVLAKSILLAGAHACPVRWYPPGLTLLPSMTSLPPSLPPGPPAPMGCEALRARRISAQMPGFLLTEGGGAERDRVRQWLEENAPEELAPWVNFAAHWTPADPAYEPEDIVGEAIRRMLDGVRLPRDPERWEAILRGTIRNVGRDLRKAEKEPAPVEAVETRPSYVRDGRGRGWRICWRAEVKRRITGAKECLTEHQRELVELRYEEEWTIAELAEHRGCVRQTVMNLLRRARAKLREALKSGQFIE